MKRICTFLLTALFVSSFVYGQKKLAYVTLDKSENMVEWALPLDNDVIVQLLNADPNIEVTVFLCDNDGNDLNTSAPVDFTGFDAIFAQETFGSGDNVWKEGYPLHIASLPLPTVYNKMYSYRNGRAFTAGEGASVEALNTYKLIVDQAGHDIFKGIDVSSGEVEVVKGGAHDTGDTGEKGMQYNTGNVVTGSIMLGHPDGAVDHVLALDEFPVGTTIDGYTIPVKVISFGMNYGQFVYPGDDDSGINLTTEGLTIWRNAIYIVCGLDVPDSPASLPTAIESVEANTLAAYAIQGGIVLPENLNASVYSVSGQLIAKEVNTNFIAVKPGIYVVHTHKGIAKIAVNR